MKNVAPSYSRGRDETSCTGPNAQLEPAQSDFTCSASSETKKLEMDEFRRLRSCTLLPPPVNKEEWVRKWPKYSQHRPQHQQQKD